MPIKAKYLFFYLFISLIIGGCSGRPQPKEVEYVQDEDIATPLLWVSRFFSRIESASTLPVKPIPGETVRAIISSTNTSDGEMHLYWKKLGTDKTHQQRITLFESSPYENTQVIAFQIPSNMEMGNYHIRFAYVSDTTSESTVWLDFEVTNQAWFQERQVIASMANVLPQASLPGITLLAEYHPMPEGTIVDDGMSEGEIGQVHATETSLSTQKSYGPSKKGDWIIYGFNPLAGMAQENAFWAIGNPIEGLTVVNDPTGPIGWPFGHKKGKRYYAVLDFSNLVTLNNQLFEAGGEGNNGKPLVRPPQIPAPPLPSPVPPPPAPQGYGLTGDLGPCPDGISTLGLVIQLDDSTGFDWLRGKSANILNELGAQNIIQIQPEQISSGFKYDPDKLSSLVRDAIKNLDCNCSEVIITVISHGKAKANGEHIMIFKDRYLERRSNKIVAKKTEINTADFISLVAKTFHDEGKDCLAVTTLLQPCYSGAVLDKAEEALRRGAGPERRKFRIMSASRANQPAYGDWNGGVGDPDIYFLEALKDCIANRLYDANGDGLVSLQEAWPCLLEAVWLRAKSQSGKDQNPDKWPNP
ncbi:MAG: hypothetical protein KUG75_14145 [Pseudomonadales bacterium]|nr:hypothetical protein [Pseudomonadales bacterium]